MSDVREIDALIQTCAARARDRSPSSNNAITKRTEGTDSSEREFSDLSGPTGRTGGLSSPTTDSKRNLWLAAASLSGTTGRPSELAWL